MKGRIGLVILLVLGLAGCGHMSSPGFRCQANDEQDFKCAGKGGAALSAENVSGTYTMEEAGVKHSLNFTNAGRVDLLFGGASKAMMTSLRSNGTEAVALKALDLAQKFVGPGPAGAGAQATPPSVPPAESLAERRAP